jgi:hypothetical protein
MGGTESDGWCRKENPTLSIDFWIDRLTAAAVDFHGRWSGLVSRRSLTV